MPLLSIVIPTRNRQAYAINSIKAILHVTTNADIVVVDSSDTGELDAMVKELNSDNRIKYHRTPTDFNVVDNFNAAFNLADGDYIVSIGDDDCIGPQIEEIAIWAKTVNAEAIGCTLKASYYWPDFYSRFFGEGYSAKLSVNEYTGDISTLNTKKALKQAADNLGKGPMQMPRAYLGMISRNLYKRICEKYGSLFGGVSPDIYSATLLSLESKLTVQIDFPFILPGSSKASTSGSSAEGKHQGKLRDNDHIGMFKNLVWNDAIPEFYSVPVVWSYSMIEALNKVKGSVVKPNYGRMFATCFTFYPGFFKYTWHAFKFANKQQNGIRFSLIKGFINEFGFQVKRVGRKMLNPKPTGSATTFSNIENIEAAYRTLNDFTVKENKQIKFQDFKQSIIE